MLTCVVVAAQNNVIDPVCVVFQGHFKRLEKYTFQILEQLITIYSTLTSSPT